MDQNSENCLDGESSGRADEYITEVRPAEQQAPRLVPFQETVLVALDGQGANPEVGLAG